MADQRSHTSSSAQSQDRLFSLTTCNKALGQAKHQQVTLLGTEEPLLWQFAYSNFLFAGHACMSKACIQVSSRSCNGAASAAAQALRAHDAGARMHRGCACAHCHHSKLPADWRYRLGEYIVVVHRFALETQTCSLHSCYDLAVILQTLHTESTNRFHC